MNPLLVAALWALVAALLVGSGFALTLSERFRRLPEHSEREMARLREEVDRLASEVSQLREEQEWMAGLLGGARPAAGLPSPNAGAERLRSPA